MNLPCEGGGFRFCPEALPGDGKLDLLVVADVPRTKVLLFLPMALLGKACGIPGSYHPKGQQDPGEVRKAASDPHRRGTAAF